MLLSEALKGMVDAFDSEQGEKAKTVIQSNTFGAVNSMRDEIQGRINTIKYRRDAARTCFAHEGGEPVACRAHGSRVELGGRDECSHVWSALTLQIVC